MRPAAVIRAVVGLGANLGDRVATLREAAARIGAEAPIARASSVWETAPVGGPPQPDYANAALALSWTGAPLALLDLLSGIERDLGRVREPAARDAPRTIDLDVLWIDGVVLDEPRLVVPHPRLHLRAFAIAPLVEVAPEAADPRTGRRYAELLPALESAPDQRIRRLVAAPFRA